MSLWVLSSSGGFWLVMGAVAEEAYAVSGETDDSCAIAEVLVGFAAENLGWMGAIARHVPHSRRSRVPGRS